MSCLLERRKCTTTRWIAKLDRYEKLHLCVCMRVHTWVLHIFFDKYAISLLVAKKGFLAGLSTTSRFARRKVGKNGNGIELWRVQPSYGLEWHISWYLNILAGNGKMTNFRKTRISELQDFRIIKSDYGKFYVSRFPAKKCATLLWLTFLDFRPFWNHM